MKNKRHTRFMGLRFALATMALLIFAALAHAQTLSLMAPAIANLDGTLTVRFGVSVEEMPILKGELEDGAELVLKCNVLLEKTADYWPDSTVASTEFFSSIKFDALTKEFVLTVPGRSTPLRNKDIKSVVQEGWGSIEAPLGPWSALERGTKYSLSVNTTMNEADAPEGLSRILYFWDWDAGSDTTFILNFTY